MASNSGGSGGQGGISGSAKVAATILGGAIIAGFIILMTGGVDSGGSPSRDVDVPTSPPQAASTGSAPTRPAGNPTARPTTASPKDALRARFPGSIIVTVTAYGMPARVGITAEDDSQVLSRGVYVEGNLDLACLPDQQYPAPCVSYVIVKPGANLTISAGQARAGPWPVFDTLKGPGCDQKAAGDRDVTCIAAAAADMTFVANYYGDDTPNGRYDYPKCPASEVARLRASSPWAARCQ